MADQISRRSKIPLYDTPWERSWTAMDMREDFDMELLKTFYDAIPNKGISLFSSIAISLSNNNLQLS